MSKHDKLKKPGKQDNTKQNISKHDKTSTKNMHNLRTLCSDQNTSTIKQIFLKKIKISHTRWYFNYTITYFINNIIFT